MKRVLAISAILAGIAFLGCNKTYEPDPPTLIAPANGAVFDTLPPAFVWNSDEFADGYKIMIDDASITSVDCLISIDVEDTTYTMPQETFDTLKNGIYCWVAAVCKDPDDNDIGVITWGESWSFVINKPDEPQGLDLDTTYFPFGLGYEWCYERYEWYCDEDESWIAYDTFTNTVTDSFWESDTLFFQYNSTTSYVRIWKNKTEVLGEIIELIPEPETRIKTSPWGTESTFSIGYKEDTLSVSERYQAPEGVYPDEYSANNTRLIGIGFIRGGHSVDSPVNYWGHGISDRLLYFYNGIDTIYKTD